MASDSWLPVKNFPPAGIHVPLRARERIPAPGKRTLISSPPGAQGLTFAAARDIGYSVFEAPTHILEVAGEYADVMQDHLLEMVLVTGAFLAGEGASALFMATPGGQPLAFLIQWALTIVGGVATAAMIGEATRQGAQWVQLAKTANGDERKITAASKAFLKTFFDLMMAALGFRAARGNLRNARNIADSLPPGGLPPFAIAGGGQIGANAAAALDRFPLPIGGPAAMATSRANEPTGTASPKQAPTSPFSDRELAQHAKAIDDIGNANHEVLRHRLLDMISRAIDGLAKAGAARVPAEFVGSGELLVRFDRRSWTIVVNEDFFMPWNIGPRMAKFARASAEVAYEIRQTQLAARYLSSQEGLTPSAISQRLGVPSDIAEVIATAERVPMTEAEIGQAQRYLRNVEARDQATHRFQVARNTYEAARAEFLKDAADPNLQYRAMDQKLSDYATPVKEYHQAVDGLRAFPEQRDLVATGARAERMFGATQRRSTKGGAEMPTAPRAGLKDIAVITSFANMMRDLMQVWSKLSPEQRLAELEKAINTQLFKCKVPTVNVVESAELGDATYAAFSPQAWTIAINRNLLRNANVSPELAGALTNTVLQQGRRVEQYYGVVTHQYYHLNWSEAEIIAEGYPEWVIDAAKADFPPRPPAETSRYFNALSPAGDDYGLVETLYTALDQAYAAYARAVHDYNLVSKSDPAVATYQANRDKAREIYDILVRLLHSLETERDARGAGDLAERIFRSRRGN